MKHHDPGLVVRDALLTPAHTDNESAAFSGAVYVGGHLLARSVRVTLPGGWRSADPERAPIVADPLRLADGTYLGRFFTHFGHFIVETLPRLHWAGGDGVLLFHPWPHEIDRHHSRMGFIRFMFDALAINEEKLLFVKEPLAVDRLLVPPRNEVLLGRVDPAAPEVYRRVREHALATVGPRRTKRVYFSRRKFVTDPRRPANEEDAEIEFARNGFTILYPETMPIREQFAAVIEAEIVAGIDGSALHLCAFMPSGGRCLALASRKSPTINVLNASVGVSTTELEVFRPNVAKPQVIDGDALRQNLHKML